MAVVLEAAEGAGRNKLKEPYEDDWCITDSSVYKTEYIDHGLQKRQPIIHTSRRKFCGDIEDKTSYMIDYTPHDLPDKFQREKRVYRPPEDPMNEKSSYQHDYEAHPGDAATSFRPRSGWIQPKVPMDDLSTYKGDFQRMDNIDMLRSRQPMAYMSNNIVNSTARFAKESTYQADYPGHRGSRPGQIVPHPSWNIGDGPMTTKSTYKDDYREVNFDPVKSMKPDSGYSRPMIRFAGESTMTGDYGHPGNPTPRSAFRPRKNCWAASGPMSDMTTFTRDYVPHYVGKPETPSWALRKALEKSDIPMEGRSTYTSSYMPHEKTMKPTQFHPGYGNVFFGDDSHAMISEYGENYIKPWTPDRVGAIIRKGQWMPPTGPFRSETTFNASYKGRSGPAAEPVRPFGNPWWSDRKGSVPNTTYHIDYIDPGHGAKASSKIATAGQKNAYHTNAMKRLMKPICPPLDSPRQSVST